MIINLIIRYTNLLDRFIISGYEIEEELEKLVKVFKINNLLNLYFNALPSVEKRIVLFTKLYLMFYDIYLPDEPINHIDIITREVLV